MTANVLGPCSAGPSSIETYEIDAHKDALRQVTSTYVLEDGRDVSAPCRSGGVALLILCARMIDLHPLNVRHDRFP